MAEDVQLRFRHTSGDIGPITFPDSTTIQVVKDKLLMDWPKDGPLGKDRPTQSADIKLILSGRFVNENSKQLKDFKKDMGELKPDTIVTMHVIVRPNNATTKQQAAPKQDKQQDKGCGCIIS